MPRSFLFLQGPSTPFFARLGKQLVSAGHKVHRVHFCSGDVAYWNGLPATRFSGAVSDLPSFFDEIYCRHGITDQVLYGDRRPVHRPAVDHGKACGVRTHVFEEGYFRPWWVTLERVGVNGHSLLPRDPDWFRGVGRSLPDPRAPIAFRSPFSTLVFHDVLFHAAGMLNPVLFPAYRTHAPVLAPVEYAGISRRLVWLRLFHKREAKQLADLLASRKRFFFLPLQLNSDAQIRDHSRFKHMGEVIEYVMESFARHAPADAVLVIKNHPMDMGLMNFRRIIADAERRYDLAGRTVYFEGGNLRAMIDHAQGVVTVNSTTGMAALKRGRPTVALSDSIYNLPGLTFQGSIDDFWRALPLPDRSLFTQFRRVVMHTTQINGGFYCRKGIALAMANSARILTAERSPLEALL